MGLSKQIRFTRRLSLVTVLVILFANHTFADERLSTNSDRKIRKSSSQESGLISTINPDVQRLFPGMPASPIERPPAPRVSRSQLPLFQVNLFCGDRFLAECLEWSVQATTFRLLNGRTIRIPTSAIATLENPPGEIEVLNELRIDAISTPAQTLSSRFLRELHPPSMARVEFRFQCTVANPLADGGQWTFDWNQDQQPQAPLVVRIGPERSMSATCAASLPNSDWQTINIADGWHSMIGLVEQDRIRLIVDDAILASIPAANATLRSIDIQPPHNDSKNGLTIDSFQVRALTSIDGSLAETEIPMDADLTRLASGDELVGQLINLSSDAVIIKTFGRQQSLPWSQIAGLNWRQSEKPIAQSAFPRTGIVATVEMQSLVDRPHCAPDRWRVTVLRVDPEQMVAQHSLAGELRFSWTEIRRMNLSFFGKSQLIDARQFHLGNSIRSDFHRHLPEGTEHHGEFVLRDVSSKKVYLTLNVVDVEAGSSDAPPASPYLTELRAGHLVTDLFVNQQKIGSLNSLVRLKSNAKNPERLRMEIPSSVLKPGNNSYQFRQQPLKPGGREFDDCELGDFRLEFEHQ